MGVEMVLELLILAAQPVADPRTVLWDNVRHGMSADEVRILYPNGGDTKHKNKEIEVNNVQIMDKCEAEVSIQHADGFVDIVKVKGDGSITGRCADKVFAALAAKYGQPMGEHKVKGDGLFKQKGDVSIWVRDDVTMRFKKFNGGALGGNGLGTASWELTYTKAAAEIAL